MTARRLPIEAGQIIQFARALGDPDPVYSDDERLAELSASGELPVPPTFTVASMHYDTDTPLRPRPGEPWCGSGRDVTGTGAQPLEAVSLHAEQHFEYFKAVRVGEELTIRQRDGRSWERVGRRGGRLRFVEKVDEFFDSRGELAIRSTSVLVTPETPVGTR